MRSGPADGRLTAGQLNFDSLKKRTFNKIALQRVAGLPVDSEIPLIGMVQRLDAQKGIDLVVEAAEAIIKETGAQLVILGRGWDNYEDILRQVARRFPENVSVFIAFEEPLARLIYAGCDMFLMPSRFEPCGLGQLIAMRYGALPVVRHTGGLVDTVSKFSPDLSEGQGFIFHDYSPVALIKAVKEARSSRIRRPGSMQCAGEPVDFSWSASAVSEEATGRAQRKITSLEGDNLKEHVLRWVRKSYSCTE
jgi:starch synthase